MNTALMRQAASLHQAGRIQEAAELYLQVLQSNPRHFEALYSLGMTQLQSGALDEAQATLGNAAKLVPRMPEPWFTRGLALLQLRRREEALACFDQALYLRPNFVEALSSRATALLEMNRLEEALAGFDKVLAIKPDHAISWNNRANTFVAMRRLEEAVASFDKALAIEPDLAIAQNNRMLALLELRKVSRIPALAVKTLFDDYASYYETAMVGSLGYQAPANLRALAEQVVAEPHRGLRILDFGCGTGLGGEAFKDWAEGGSLDGIDLSEPMIEKARARGIYTDLVIGDFESTATGKTYDLVIAADAVIYSGDLVPTFVRAKGALEPGGYFLFTIERKEGEGWEQTPANRFRHSEAYIRQGAASAGFDFVALSECTLRRESREGVVGFAVALRKPITESASPSAA
jgi:predicted TPR repeat methyltransferase